MLSAYGHYSNKYTSSSVDGEPSPIQSPYDSKNESKNRPCDSRQKTCIVIHNAIRLGKTQLLIFLTNHGITGTVLK